jgi:hypothetical protein
MRWHVEAWTRPTVLCDVLRNHRLAPSAFSSAAPSPCVRAALQLLADNAAFVVAVAVTAEPQGHPSVSSSQSPTDRT